MRWYSSLLRSWPVSTNAVQGAVLCAVGDIGAQILERRDAPDVEPSTLGVRRCASAAAIGTAFGAFIYPTAYRILDARWPTTSIRTVLMKSVAEVATLGTVGNAFSIGGRVVLEGDGPSAACEQISREMMFVLKNELRLWLPWNVFLFALVPAHLRPGSTMLVEAGWTTYISWVAHRKDAATCV
ncbi:hypothetical protein AB1Y20_020238 [Prymnesium parvum]|uniref:Mitochondrial fission process protein 1 n=1 Tax=Prymnesium parvum TaxID=97485 RepID=A0AB34JSX4_PRYPA